MVVRYFIDCWRNVINCQISVCDQSRRMDICRILIKSERIFFIILIHGRCCSINIYQVCFFYYGLILNSFLEVHCHHIVLCFQNLIVIFCADAHQREIGPFCSIIRSWFDRVWSVRPLSRRIAFQNTFLWEAFNHSRCLHPLILVICVWNQFRALIKINICKLHLSDL